MPAAARRAEEGQRAEPAQQIGTIGPEPANPAASAAAAASARPAPKPELEGQPQAKKARRIVPQMVAPPQAETQAEVSPPAGSQSHRLTAAADPAEPTPADELAPSQPAASCPPRRFTRRASLPRGASRPLHSLRRRPAKQQQELLVARRAQPRLPSPRGASSPRASTRASAPRPRRCLRPQSPPSAGLQSASAPLPRRPSRPSGSRRPR